MTKRWRIHAETLAEIDATAAWYDRQRAGLDLEFLAELRERWPRSEPNLVSVRLTERPIATSTSAGAASIDFRIPSSSQRARRSTW